MPDLLSVVSVALQADQSRLEQTSLNAANASTPGYRRSGVASIAFDQVMDSAQQSGMAGKSWLPPAPVLQRAIDFTPAALMQTGRPLDVAVEGEGFIALTDGQRRWLTRAAALSVASTGELVGPRGLRVVSDAGELRPGTEQEVAIQGDGTVQVGGRAIGRIQILQPEDVHALTTQDGVLFEVGEQLTESAVGKAVLRPGFLEGSNTHQLKEMLGVMETVRHFESLIRLAQGYDEVMGRTIQKLGEV